MARLINALNAWGTPEFQDILKDEIEQMDAEQLPLQAALSMGSHAIEDGLRAMLLSASDDDDRIQAKAGIFYNSIIAGCSCADDPTPIDIQSEYCEVRIDINKITAEAEITLLSE